MKEKLSKEFIINLSKDKNEPSWMLDIRLKAYEEFLKL
jgi:Fe-S cluster assembly scaffold protein SufB